MEVLNNIEFQQLRFTISELVEIKSKFKSGHIFLFYLYVNLTGWVKPIWACVHPGLEVDPAPF